MRQLKNKLYEMWGALRVGVCRCEELLMNITWYVTQAQLGFALFIFVSPFTLFSVVICGSIFLQLTCVVIFVETRRLYVAHIGYYIRLQTSARAATLDTL